MPELVDELVLTPDQSRGLEEAAKFVDTARAELGESYLRYEEMRAAFEKAEANLRRVSARARQAEVQHRSIVQRISQVLQLPEGEWTYDQPKTRLVRKGASDV